MPVVVVLVNKLPMNDVIMNRVFHYLKANGLSVDLLMVNHDGCHYAQKIVGY